MPIGSSVTSSPASAATQAAIIVSASGIGAAWRPATRSAARMSVHSAPAPPAASGTPASGTPVSATARHNSVGKAPRSARSMTSLVLRSSNSRFMLSSSSRVSSRIGIGVSPLLSATRGRAR